MVDFHTHTVCSDGKATPEELIEKAIAQHILYLAITDHNYVHKNLDELREKYKGRITLINGVELSTVYDSMDGEKTEVHVVGLGVDSEKMDKFMAENSSDRKSYIEAIRKKMKENCNIDLPPYEEFQKMYPRSGRIGRMCVGDYLLGKGVISSIDELFHIYLGNKGERRAYVNALDFSNYAQFEDGVRAIIDAGGIPVLAHLFAYPFTDQERNRMVRRFKEAAGEHPAGIEVYYGKYSREKRKILREIADRWGLYYSSASDYHAKTPEDHLMNPQHLDRCPMDRHVLSLFLK